MHATHPRQAERAQRAKLPAGITQALTRATCIAATCGFAIATPTRAQVTTPPSLGASPTLTLPGVEKAALPNGLTVMVSRNTEVPIVSAQLLILGGARLTGAPAGMATFAADMLDEGAAGRNTFQLADELAFLGARLSTGAGWENFSVALSGPKRTFPQAMALMADVVLRPTFAAADVKRQRDLRLTQLLSARDQPGTVAQRVFYRNVFPAAHPYHVSITGDSATTVPLDSASVRQFWNRAADPRRATLIMTGDVTLAEATTWARQHFGSWSAPASPLPRPLPATVAAAAPGRTRVILVDKPNAAQSVILIGAPGIARSAPDYTAITLMNTILGGSFSARLNDILREQRGYSYGASSGYSWQPVAGPFIASSQVRTDVTDSSLAVFFREFGRIRNESITAQELERGKNYIILGSLGDYETAGSVGGAISESILFNKPLSDVTAEMARIKTLTVADVQRAAQHIDPTQLTVVVVGDIVKIRPGIEKLNLGPIEVQTF